MPPPPKPTNPLISVDEIHALVDARSAAEEPPPLPPPVVAASLILGLPLVMGITIPLAITYHAGKALLWNPLFGGNKKSLLAPIDSGITITNDVKERKDRPLDIVVLGATGFTGRLAALHLAQAYGKEKQQSIKWAIAGRSAKKLNQVKQDLAKELDMPHLVDSIQTIIVDTSDPTTIPALVKDTRVVITTAGPFEMYGSPVVEGCAKYGTHYVDITGETGWVKHMILKWQTTAQQSGAKLISLCGCDSIPWDMSVFKLESMLEENDKEETLKSVVFVNESKGAASGGTLATIALGLSGQSRGSPGHDFDVYQMLPDGSESACKTIFNLPGRVKKHSAPGRYKNAWLSPFIMSFVNIQVVTRSNALRQRSDGMSYFEALGCDSLSKAIVNWLGLPLVVCLFSNPLTQWLFEQVLPKPGEGPSMDDMINKFYFSATGYGVGSKGTKVESVIYFPRCVGYIETGRMVAESALCLVLEEDRLPSNGGGFFTTSTGLGQVLLDRLVKTGTYFACRKVE